MKDRVKLAKKICLSLNTLTFASTQILLFTLFPLLSDRLGISLSVVAGCFSLGTLLFLWGAPYWAAKSDDLGRQEVMSYGLMGLALSFAMITSLLTFSNSMSSITALLILVGSRILYGSVASAIVPVAQAARGDMSVKGEHMKSMLSHSLTLSLGRTLGPCLLLLCAGHVEILLLIITLWSFLLLILNLLLSPRDVVKKTRPTTHKHPKKEWKSSAQEIFWPLIIAVLFTTYTGILHSSLGQTLKISFNLDSLEASQLMAKLLIMGSFLMATVQIAGRFTKKLNWTVTLSAGTLFMASGALTLALMNSLYQAWMAIGLVSIGIALIQPSNLTIIHEHIDKSTSGKKIGLLSSGNIIGYAAGGTLATLFIPYNIHLISLTVISILAVTVYLTCKKYSDREEEALC